MQPAESKEQIAEASPRRTARIAGAFYLLTFLTGMFAFLDRSRLGMAAGIVGGVFYMGVTALFYYLFKPVDRSLSLIAACFSVAGFLIGILDSLHLDPWHVNGLAFFGVYCLLIGRLIFKSTFLPRILGVLMAIGGLGWLTFASPDLASDLSPFNLAPGLLGEGALTLWLLAKGVNAERWKEQAVAAGEL